MTNQLTTIYRFDDLSFSILRGYKVCIHSAKCSVAFLAESLWPVDANNVSLPFSGGSVGSTRALTVFNKIIIAVLITRVVSTDHSYYVNH